MTWASLFDGADALLRKTHIARSGRACLQQVPLFKTKRYPGLGEGPERPQNSRHMLRREFVGRAGKHAVLLLLQALLVLYYTSYDTTLVEGYGEARSLRDDLTQLLGGYEECLEEHVSEM